MKYLDSLNGLYCVPGLDSIRELLYRLGNPQDCVKYIHIAGTNGKGSVGSYITEVLITQGYSVGRYVSPAVLNPLEIIQFNKTPIEEDVFDEIIDKIHRICDEMVEDGLRQPTRFEVETAAAYIFFADKRCDFAVIECGMGGLLDATNVIVPKCSVITSISVDHTSFLGDSITEITSHKAGIIKNNVPVVSAIQNEDAMSVIKVKAIELSSELTIASEICNVRPTKDGIYFDYKEYKDLCTSILGTYQPMNAALAIECILCLKRQGYYFSDENVYAGILKANWFGRFTKLGSNPDFWIDGAHNADGGKALLECLKTYYPNEKLTFIVGFLADKDYKSILDLCMPFCKRFIAIETPDNPRALSSKALAEFVKNNYDVGVVDFDSINDAVANALSYKDSAIIVFGSLSHLAMVKEAYDNHT